VTDASSLDEPFFQTIFKTMTSPPSSRPAATGDLLDLHVPPGIVRWIYTEMPPGFEGSVHHTDTVDFDTIVSGSVEIVLGDGAHCLGAGDCVVITGVDHGWKAGAEGCVMSVVAIGTVPPTE